MYVHIYAHIYTILQCGNHQTVVLSHSPPIALQAELGLDIDQVLTFAPTDTEKCVQFPIADDNIALEPDETLMFRLVLTGNVTGVSLGSFATTTITIQDDDSKSLLLW